MNRLVIALLGSVLYSGASMAQKQTYFTNPVIRGDVADPSIIRIDDTYYATGTSSEWAPYYPVFTSKDLVNWKQTGHVFEQQPEWTKSSFWAPEWYYHNGKVYVYYTARKKSNNTSYIGVATSDSPTGKFKDHGPIVEFGTEAIDAFILEDKGDLYISWKAYGLDNRPIELLASKLTPDGLKLTGKPFSLLRDDERAGMEGQHWFKKNGYYYLIYAINGCCGPNSDYAVAVARSKKLEGPYEKYEGNPILHGSDEIQSIGHGTLTTTPDGRMFYLCHAYSEGSYFFLGRHPHLQELRFGEDNWPYFVTGEYARLTGPMPFADCVQEPITGFFDNFADSDLRPEWSWNYPYSNVQTKIEAGRLWLSGSPKPECKTGEALCLRPASSGYTLDAGITNQNGSWKGITLYGDNSYYIAYGPVGDRLQIKLVREGKEQQLADLPLPSMALHLRMQVKEGLPYQFAWSKDGRQWTPVNHGLSEEAIRSLIRWDRVARPGLYHEGDEKEPAVFEYCSLSYQ